MIPIAISNLTNSLAGKLVQQGHQRLANYTFSPMELKFDLEPWQTAENQRYPEKAKKVKHIVIMDEN